MSRTILARLALVAAVLITLAVLWLGEFPLGVSGEWTWSRIPLSWDTVLGSLVASAVGVVYLVFVIAGRRRLPRANGAETCGWLTLLIVAAFVWLSTVQQSVPAPFNLARVPWVLYYPRSSGYFWQARYEVTNARPFLADYEQLMSQRDYLHIGTHPPGLTLAYRGLLQVCENWPFLRTFLVATQPAAVRESFAVLREPSNQQGGHVVEESDIACLWLAALLTQLAASITTVGVYLLARRRYNTVVSWEVSALWPLVPAIGVFLPKSDVLLTLPAVLTAWLWLSGRDRNSLVRCLLAGAMVWVGLMISLAFITVLLVIAATTLFEMSRRSTQNEPDRDPRHSPSRRTLSQVAAALAGFGVPVLWMATACDCNLINVWWWNLQNHALFYEHNSRTWWKWLLVNPLELSLAVGLPITFATALKAWRLFRSDTWRKPAGADLLSFLLVWSVLWISGKNMGEAARLWILLMPWVVLGVAARAIRSPRLEDGSRRGDTGIGQYPALLAAQLLVCVLTVTRIDGFHFGELEQPVPSSPANPAGEADDLIVPFAPVLPTGICPGPDFDLELLNAQWPEFCLGPPLFLCRSAIGDGSADDTNVSAVHDVLPELRCRGLAQHPADGVWHAPRRDRGVRLDSDEERLESLNRSATSSRAACVDTAVALLKNTLHGGRTPCRIVRQAEQTLPSEHRSLKGIPCALLLLTRPSTGA